MNKQDRVYKKYWEKDNSWLVYDEEKDIMWCRVCYEFRDLVLEINPKANMNMLEIKLYYLEFIFISLTYLE